MRLKKKANMKDRKAAPAGVAICVTNFEREGVGEVKLGGYSGLRWGSEGDQGCS